MSFDLPFYKFWHRRNKSFVLQQEYRLADVMLTGRKQGTPGRFLITKPQLKVRLAWRTMQSDWSIVNRISQSLTLCLTGQMTRLILLNTCIFLLITVRKSTFHQTPYIGSTKASCPSTALQAPQIPKRAEREAIGGDGKQSEGSRSQDQGWENSQGIWMSETFLDRAGLH